jgi:hypothetical protein
MSDIKVSQHDKDNYMSLLRASIQHDHYYKTWKLYNYTVQLTKCHKQALNIAYMDLRLDSKWEGNL